MLIVSHITALIANPLIPPSLTYRLIYGQGNISWMTCSVHIGSVITASISGQYYKDSTKLNSIFESRTLIVAVMNVQCTLGGDLVENGRRSDSLSAPIYAIAGCNLQRMYTLEFPFIRSCL